MMEIRSAEFLTSAATPEGYLRASAGYTCGEICFVGRSNVGKSSFINMLCRRNRLAKTSSLPGRTRLINLFSVNGGELVFVDLPGYGYAAASRTEREGWGALIEGYLTQSDKLRRILLLADIRIGATALDKQMIDYMHFHTLPFTVIATKCDKLSRAKTAVAVMQLASGLAVGRDDIIPVSSVNGTGRDAVLALLDGAAGT